MGRECRKASQLREICVLWDEARGEALKKPCYTCSSSCTLHPQNDQTQRTRNGMQERPESNKGQFWPCVTKPLLPKKKGKQVGGFKKNSIPATYRGPPTVEYLAGRVRGMRDRWSRCAAFPGNAPSNAEPSKSDSATSQHPFSRLYKFSNHLNTEKVSRCNVFFRRDSLRVVVQIWVLYCLYPDICWATHQPVKDNFSDHQMHAACPFVSAILRQKGKCFPASKHSVITKGNEHGELQIATAFRLGSIKAIGSIKPAKNWLPPVYKRTL